MKRVVNVMNEILSSSKNDIIRLMEIAPIEIPDTGLIVGFTRIDNSLISSNFGAGPNFTLGDNMHFPMGTSFLELGFQGVSKKAKQNISEEKTTEQNSILESISEVYSAASAFVLRHIKEIDNKILVTSDTERDRLLAIRDNLYGIVNDAPSSFAQAIQLYYLAWRVRCVSRTATIGRLDMYLFPFYEKDIKAERLTRDEALNLICDLWENINKCGSGDTLVNIMLGGCDTNGNDETNELSILMLEASIIVHKSDPHLNARFHKHTRKDFQEIAYKLQLCGSGKPTIFNDEVIIPSLINAGIPKAYAYNYSNDGCSEILIDGMSSINFQRIDIVKILELALFNGEKIALPGDTVVQYWSKYEPARTWDTPLEYGFESGNIVNFTSYDEVYNAFLKQFLYQINIILNGLYTMNKRLKSSGVTSLFLNGSFNSILNSGDDMLRGGLPVDCITIFSGSIPTAADGLAAIKNVIFEKRKYTLSELLTALRNNFNGYEIMRRELQNAPKFGNDDDYVDLIASDIVNFFCDCAENFSKSHDINIWPALFNHLFVQEAVIVGATPDGRRWKDPISEHYSPTPGRAVKGPTAVISSAGKAPLRRAYGTAPVHISLSRSIFPKNDESIKIIETLVSGAINKGFVCFNIAIYDVKKLREAKKNPEAHKDLIVRVWGYSARFVDLSEEMQDHVISRVIKE